MRGVNILFFLLIISVAVNGAPRIVGGSRVVIEMFPYTVSVQFDQKHICGGAVIKENIIATAAHCIKTPYEFYAIRAGSTFVNSFKDTGVLVNVSDIKVHPNYDRSTADYDIALLFLRSNLTYGSSIQPVALYDSNYVPMDAEGNVTGWGTTDRNNPSEVSQVLKNVRLSVIDRLFCKRNYPPGAITQNMICAGSRVAQEDACAGDSGGPLVYNKKLLGITSWGFSCADQAYPGVYTFIPRVLDFIKKYTV